MSIEQTPDGWFRHPAALVEAKCQQHEIYITTETEPLYSVAP